MIAPFITKLTSDMKKLLLLVVLCSPLFLLAQAGAYLGVHGLHMSNKKAKKLGFETSDGYYIARVIPNTPAETAGFQPFDYIYAINGETLKNGRDLGDVLDDIQPGTSTTFTYLRDGQKQEATVAVAERGHRPSPRRSAEEDPFLGVSPSHDEMPKGVTGVVVNISECSTAAEMGLEDGDLINRIDDRLMFDWNDLHYAIDNRSVGDPIKITYYRAAQAYEAVQNIKSLSATENCETSETMEAPAEEAIPVVAEVEMENVSEAEAKAMEAEKGVEMPIVNNLSITELQLFPNPTSGIFELRFDLPNEGVTSIRLFDATARLVYQKQLGRFSGNFSEQVDISNRTRGTYYLEIRQDALSISKKLILQ